MRKLNLSTHQQTALRNLSNYEDIIIKKADKGSNVVIQNREDYIQEGLNQLNDSKFYLRVESDLSPKFKKKIDSFVQSMLDNNEIDEKTFHFLTSGGNRTPIFYILPKIHKKFNKIPTRETNCVQCG